MTRLLFFTPVLPSPTGQGSAIRASIAVEILSEMFEVVVVHVDAWGGRAEVMDESWVLTFAAGYHLVPVPVEPGAARQLVTQHLSGAQPDAVYVFRLASALLALQVMSLLPQRRFPDVLDLDDDECARAERFIPLYQAAGEHGRADRVREGLGRLRTHQKMLFSRFAVNMLASEEDRQALAARYPGKHFLHLPNVVRASAELSLSATVQAPSLLFLGTLDYLPNEDAVVYFCEAIWPQLNGRATLRVVGTNPSAAVRDRAEIEGVTIVGPVRDVAPEYARARVMVVPLRAGSGTRIKILEAFSFGVPVVSTSAGAAGLDARDGIHLLIADTPEEFAAACLRLLTDDELAATLRKNAHHWLRQTHSPDRVRRILTSLYRAALPGGESPEI